jgi:dihydrofolate reductase
MSHNGDTRTVIGNITLSLDGRVHGADGEHDMAWLLPHAVSDAPRDLMARLTNSATTVLLGRKNYEGFGGYWPTVADDENAAPHDREFARWLNAIEKVVFSRTLTAADWQNSRLVDSDPAAEVKSLREQGGGDILIFNSGSIITALLSADELDRLTITLCPEVIGGGARLFNDGLPASSWSLTDVATSETGAACLIYDRVRDDK